MQGKGLCTVTIVYYTIRRHLPCITIAVWAVCYFNVWVFSVRFDILAQIPQIPEGIDSKRWSPAVVWDDVHTVKWRRCIKNHWQMLLSGASEPDSGSRHIFVATVYRRIIWLACTCGIDWCVNGKFTMIGCFLKSLSGKIFMFFQFFQKMVGFWDCQVIQYAFKWISKQYYLKIYRLPQVGHENEKNRRIFTTRSNMPYTRVFLSWHNKRASSSG